MNIYVQDFGYRNFIQNYGIKQVYEEGGVHYYEDGHFWMEVPGLPERDSDDDSHILVKQNMKVKFSADPIKVLFLILSLCYCIILKYD